MTKGVDLKQDNIITKQSFPGNGLTNSHIQGVTKEREREREFVWERGRERQRQKKEKKL